MLIRKERCLNLNHQKSNAFFRFCSMCGEAVNENIQIKKCNEEEHATMRRERNKYCVDCGKQLI